jgi:HK97 family phage major capsid protein
MAMELKDLERMIDERSQKQIDSAKEAIKNELGAVPQAQIDEAVKKAVADITAKAENDKAENVKYLEAFKEAVGKDNSIKAKETPVTIVNQMIASAVSAMGHKDAHNITQVSPEEVLAQAKKDFPYSKALHNVLEARCKTMNAGTPSEGGFTVPLAFSGEYIDALVANTLIDKLNIRRVPLVHGNLSIPRMDTTSAISWGGEETVGGITEPTFGEVNMRAKKLFAKTAMSNTLIRESGVNIEGWVAEDLMRKARIALDDALLNGTGSQYQPLGLANTAGIQTSGSTSTAFGLTTPNDMVALLEQANVRMENVHWLLNPMGESWIRNKAFASGPFAWSDEMSRTGRLRGYEFHSSSTVKYVDTTTDYADFWLGDFAEMMFGISKDISIEVSREGTFTNNGNVVSAFDRDLTLIRLIAEVDFACRQPKAFVHGTYSVA